MANGNWFIRPGPGAPGLLGIASFFPQLHLGTLKNGTPNVLDAHQAYLNFVGGRLDSDAWANQKSFFNSAEYQGIEGTLKRIAESRKSQKIEEGKRPF